MATLSVANLKTFMDSVAKQIEVAKAALGTDGTDTGTAAEGAQNNLDRVLGYDDADQEGDLLGPAQFALNRVSSTNALPRLFENIVRAVSNHVGGLNDFLSTNDARVHYLLREAASWIDAANVFPPVVDPVCSFAATGATAGTFTAGTAIDTDSYGKANMVIEVTSTGITTETTVTLTMVKIDGTTEDKEVTLANTLTQNDEVDIGTHDTDMYVNCTAISITGGTSGDSFKVKSEIERAIAL